MHGSPPSRRASKVSAHSRSGRTRPFPTDDRNNRSGPRPGPLVDGSVEQQPDQVADELAGPLGWHFAGEQYSAAFVHDITVRDDKVVALVQITDTQCWHDALVAS
ncbi:hypothetical protein MAUB_48620 [Mycolicibacterium aubagnense]|uniref:Uncharacterized protein n=1 Tax=Mycolicibacterium aubagnense TaxID=319707 RepID=A0ABN5Z1M8_9MYCO|nr:hypothetical protein C1S80_07730 [Mycolicibacterium aubagnense]BBX86989.1 hypothetical protein MAUB_48620 [Mycolicibacterium aubagnense]